MYRAQNHLFPFYQLPIDVQAHIVPFMDTKQVLQGCLVSPNFRVAIARAKTVLTWLYMFDEGVPSISCTLGWPPRRCDVQFYWLEQKYPVDCLLQGRLRSRINKDLWMTVLVDNIVIYNSSPRYSMLADYQFTLDVIFATFKVRNIRIGMPKESLFPLAYRYRNYVQEAIHLDQSTRRGVCEDLTSDELSALLENLKVPKFRLSWKTEPGVRYTGILKGERMWLRGASWLTLDNLMTMECKFLEADVNLTALELGSFVRKFLEGGFEKLQTVCLHAGVNWQGALDEFEGVVIPNAYGCRKKLLRSDGKVAVVEAGTHFFKLDLSE